MLKNINAYLCEVCLHYQLNGMFEDVLHIN